jgi:hypothetical protein
VSVAPQRFKWRDHACKLCSVTLFFANFGAAKIAIYFAPLLVARFAPVQVYGAFEFAMAAGAILALAVTGFVYTAVPQLHLVRSLSVCDLTAATALFGMSICGGGAIALTIVGAPAPTITVPLISGLIVGQGALSVYARSFAKRLLAAWVDGLATLTISGVIAMVQFSSTDGLTTVNASLGATLAVASVGAAFAWWSLLGPEFFVRLKLAARLGTSNAMLSLFSLWVGASGRVIIGFTLALDAVATYSVAFRIAGLLLAVHQVFITGLFAKAYAARTRAFDRLAGLHLAGLSVASLGLAILGPWLVTRLGLRPETGLADRDLAVLMCVTCLQVLFWIASATLEMRLNRARLAQRMFPWNLGILALIAMAFGLMMLAHAPTLLEMAWLIAVQNALFFAVAWLVLAFRGLPLPRIGIAVASGATLLCLIALARAI